jgi:hypothetical protein
VGIGHVVPEREVEELVAAAMPDKEEPFCGLVKKTHVPKRRTPESPKE